MSNNDKTGGQAVAVHRFLYGQRILKNSRPLFFINRDGKKRIFFNL